MTLENLTVYHPSPMDQSKSKKYCKSTKVVQEKIPNMTFQGLRSSQNIEKMCIAVC